MTKQEWLKLKNGTDIRGVAVEGVEGERVNLTPTVVQTLAKAFYLWLQNKTGKQNIRIAVGHDSRVSANALCQAVQTGVVACGGEVVVTGLSSTPSMFMLLQKEHFACDGSIMLTASHLPFNKNGMKFFVKEGGLESADVTSIINLACENNFPTGEGKVIYRSFIDEYCQDLVQLTQKATGEEQPLLGKKIIVDAGNGAGGFYAEKVLKPLGANIDGSQFLEPEGTFPNHIPNPENKAAMQSICDAVLREKADLGIIFDTDVDRAGAVDKDGKEINRNRLIALIAAILLEEKKDAYIVTDSVTSNGLAAFIQARGGIHHRFKRGYKNVINEAIRLTNEGKYAPLAIETSGHAALQENYFLDDGAYLVTKLLIALALRAKEGKELSSLINDLPMPAEEAEIRPTFKNPDDDFKSIGKGIINDLFDFGKTTPFITLAPDNFEGVRMNFDKEHGNGWTLVRMSLHEPILPINFESDELGGSKKMIRIIYDFLKNYPALNLTPFEKYL